MLASGAEEKRNKTVESEKPEGRGPKCISTIMAAPRQGITRGEPRREKPTDHRKRPKGKKEGILFPRGTPAVQNAGAGRLGGMSVFIVVQGS